MTNEISRLRLFKEVLKDCKQNFGNRMNWKVLKIIFTTIFLITFFLLFIRIKFTESGLLLYYIVVLSMSLRGARVNAVNEKATKQSRN